LWRRREDSKYDAMVCLEVVTLQALPAANWPLGSYRINGIETALYIILIKIWPNIEGEDGDLFSLGMRL
jgi:hypothetical protein